MRKFRFGLIGFAVIIIIGQLTITDFNDFTWSNNAGSFLGIISMIFLIIAMIGSNQYEKKHSK